MFAPRGCSEIQISYLCFAIVAEKRLAESLASILLGVFVIAQGENTSEPAIVQREKCHLRSHFCFAS